MQMWSCQDSLGFTATVTYDSLDSFYTVTVEAPDGRSKSTSFLCLYPPIFGMDVVDMHQSQDIATALSEELESEA